LPPFETTNFVAEDDPIANAGAEPFAAVGFTERNAHGDDVPCPMNPFEKKVVVAVPPKYACVAEICVVEALPLRSISEVVALCPAAGCVNGSPIELLLAAEDEMQTPLIAKQPFVILRPPTPRIVDVL
jgi:hypothetical protein